MSIQLLRGADKDSKADEVPQHTKDDKAKADSEREMIAVPGSIE